MLDGNVVLEMRWNPKSQHAGLNCTAHYNFQCTLPTLFFFFFFRRAALPKCKLPRIIFAA